MVGTSEATALPPLPRIVILDYYDSYTNNLLALFTKLYPDDEVLRKVVVIKADCFSWEEFQAEILPNIDAVILSPGPGRPDVPSDIGFALDLIRLHTKPTLGVCLGHQAIGVAFGGKIINMPNITHGHVVHVEPVSPGIGLFAHPAWHAAAMEGNNFDATVYNSLSVDASTLPDELQITAWSGETERTIQGVAHREYPIWGVQYHPESICSTRGSALLHAFLSEVHAHHYRPSCYPPLIASILDSCAYRVLASSSRHKSRPRPLNAFPTPSPTVSRASSVTDLASAASTRPSTPVGSKRYRSVEKKFGDLGRDTRTQDAFEALRDRIQGIGAVWLDGQTPTRPTNTSLAIPSFLLTYTLSSRTVRLHRGDSTAELVLDEETFWDWFSEGHNHLSSQLASGSRGGWRGGWVGWFGYEMKEESLAGYHRKPRQEDGEEVDACWAWCDQLLSRSLDGEWAAVGIVDDGGVSENTSHMIEWLEAQGVTFGVANSTFSSFLSSIPSLLEFSSSHQPAPAFPTFKPLANGHLYRSRVDAAREFIRQGESYELTLTTRFESRLLAQSPYELYLRLRTFNPAYYSTFLSFPTLNRGKGIHVLSSSPERFLKIQDRELEMMPIKGTRARVKPGQCICVDGRGCGGRSPGSRECEEEGKREDKLRGEQLQADPKERAENLMIVDLIRADLLSCCTPSTVVVPKLIALESYGVHNLVTTVQGQLARNVGSVEAVRRCFPPGSMTGAPKLRSVQILEGIEGGERRGVYSGALGYIGLDGEVDLSVVIRTMVVYGDEIRIGAGGAITWLSDRDGEWDEVLTKVKSVVGPLEGVE